MSVPVVVGNSFTMRFAATTRALTEAESKTFLEGGGLPAGIGTETGVSAVALEYQEPGGAWVVKTLAKAEVVKDAVGAYHVTQLAPTIGVILWRGRGYDSGGKEVWATPIEEQVVTASAVNGARLSAAVNAVLNEAPFDTTEAAVLRWLNARHELMCARTACFRERVPIGLTTKGVVSYAVPARVVDIRELQVAGVRYGTGKHTDIVDGANNFLWLSGYYVGLGGGISAHDYDTAGNTLVSLFPTPEETGLEILVFAVCRPEVLEVPGASFKTPPEFDDALIAGAIATGLARTDARTDLAAQFQATFDTACGELLTQVRRRDRGPAPAQIRVQGYN